MNQPEPQSLSFNTLRSDIERGLIKIPQFQREFVWPKDKAAKLLDSILKGYPIGTFILWKTKESLRTVKNIGGAQLPDTPPGDFIHHVLDGQQRLTSIYASMKGLRVERDGKHEDFSQMFIDLAATGDQDVVRTDPTELDPSSTIRVVELLNAGFAFLSKYPPQYHGKLDEYKTRLESYAFSAILVREAPIEVATEIFTRINVGGKPLSVFEIMVAKTFDPTRRFDLSERYEELVGQLAEVGYDTIAPSVILQTVSTLLVKECTKSHILRLTKSDFIEIWPRAISAIHETVDYFRNYFRVPVSNLLPFGALIVPFSYFFYMRPGRPSADQEALLEDFFWRCGLGARYSHSLETHLAQDIRRIDEILQEDIPEYDYPIDTSPAFIMRNGNFTTGRSYTKALLCLLAYQEPKSFVNNSVVRISNDWLKQANSKNYHHFFPRSFLKREGVSDELANHIANITIVDDYLNKREIGYKPPAQYMQEFAGRNRQLAGTMKTHLIDLDTFGIWENDYAAFLTKRCEAMSKEIEKRIIPRDTDSQAQEIREEAENAEEIALL